MGESLYFLPSEVARLVLGYIKTEGYANTCKAFMKECEYLTEYVNLLKQGREFPLSVGGLTLTMMLDDYARMTIHDTGLKTGQTNNKLLWKQLESIVGTLKHGDPDRKQKSFLQSAFQSARTRRQISEAKSPEKTFTSVRQVESNLRVPIHTCSRQAKSPARQVDVSDLNSVSVVTIDNDATGVGDVVNDKISTDSTEAKGVRNKVRNVSGGTDNINDVDKTGVDSVTNPTLSVPNIESTEKSKRLQEILEKNSQKPESWKRSTSEADSLLKVRSVSKIRTEPVTSVTKPVNEAVKSNSEKKNCSSVSSDNRNSQEVQHEAIVSTVVSAAVSPKAKITSKLKDNEEKTKVDLVEEKLSDDHSDSNSDSEAVPVSKESEIKPSSNADDSSETISVNNPDMSDEQPRIPQKPEISEITNGNTCDSWLNGAPGIKEGDKLLEKFGIHQTSSSDSSDHEIAKHMQIPVTPSKSRPLADTGLITPVKQLQMAENSSKSPRRKKPKTPRKRLSDASRKTSGSAKEHEGEDHKVQEVIEPLLHDKKLHQKIAEISTVVLGKTLQSRSHHKSGDSSHELTAEELETITASQSLEEILETESFGQDLNLDLSDPVFEGLFRLFGTDKEAFHENLRREKQKIEVMEAEVEELEKSIHEEMVACGNLMGSQGDEGYETQRTQCMDELYSSPKPSCSSQTGASEMSSPISQPHTPHQNHQTSFTSSPYSDRRQEMFVPQTPCSGQLNGYSPSSHVTEPFSPAMTESSLLSVNHTAIHTPSNTTRNFSPADQTLDPESPCPHRHDSIESPAGSPSNLQIVLQNPPQSPNDMPSIVSRRTPVPCSPLVKNDIQPSTPHMVQKYHTPFTPSSKHKSVMVAGTVRPLFSAQIDRQIIQPMTQTCLGSAIPEPIQAEEASTSSKIQPTQSTSTNQSMNYTNFVSEVSSGDNRSTPINIGAKSMFYGDMLTTIDNTIGCISLPPSQSAFQIPPVCDQEKGKKAGRGRGKKATKPKEQGKVQPGGFSTLIGLLEKPPQVPSVGVPPAATSSTLSMPVLTQQTDSNTVVLNASDDDIHNHTISILSPGGQNYVEVPILDCQDEEVSPKSDIVSKAMSQSDVNSATDTVCVWSENLNTSTHLTVLSPPSDNTSAHPKSELKMVNSEVQKGKLPQSLKKNKQSSAHQVQKEEKRKSSKKKLNLETSDDKVESKGNVDMKDKDEVFFCYPGEVLTAEPLNEPQKKVFIRNLNFGPNAGNTRGGLMPSRKVSKGSTLAPFMKKKSSDFTTVSVNITKDIKYRKIMPKPSTSVSVNIVHANQEAEKTSAPAVARDGRNHVTGASDRKLILNAGVSSGYDSDTLSYESLSPVKFRDSKKKLDKGRTESKISKEKESTSNTNQSTKQTKSSKESRKNLDSKVTEDKKSDHHKRPHPEKGKGKKSSYKSTKANKNRDEKNEREDYLEPVKHLPAIEGSAVEKNSSKAANDNNKVKAERKKKTKKTTSPRSDETDACAKAEKPDKTKTSKSKEDTSNRTRKKTEKQLKVKIVSKKEKIQSDKRAVAQRSARNLNKVFTKSPEKSSQKSKPNTEESDEDIPLKILKEDLRKTGDRCSGTLEENQTARQEICDSSMTNTVSENCKFDENVAEIACKTPEKRTGESPGKADYTPSKEKVLETLGLTPKKNAKDMLENMQSPSRTNIIDLLIQLTPKSEQSPKRRRISHCRQQANIVKTPEKNIRTPAKRLFGSPVRKRTVPNGVEKTEYIPVNNQDSVVTKNDQKASVIVISDENSSDNVSVKQPNVVDNIGKIKIGEDSKATVKNNAKVTSKVTSPAKKSLECLSKEAKKVTPLRIKDLYKNTKVAVDRNKEFKGGLKRPPDSSNQELEIETNRNKTAKKARNSLDLSVSDYEKMMAKLGKLHKCT